MPGSSHRNGLARIAFGEGGRKRHVYFVRDNGAGFDMRHVDKLFGAFQRLSLRNRIPRHRYRARNGPAHYSPHGGDVWAEGKVNEGARLLYPAGPLDSEEKEHESEGARVRAGVCAVRSPALPVHTRRRTFPTARVRPVNPYTPGGSVDLVSFVATGLSKCGSSR